MWIQDEQLSSVIMDCLRNMQMFKTKKKKETSVHILRFKISQGVNCLVLKCPRRIEWNTDEEMNRRVWRGGDYQHSFFLKSLQDSRIQGRKCHSSCSHSLYLCLTCTTITASHMHTSLIMCGCKGPPFIAAGGEICSWWHIQRVLSSVGRDVQLCLHTDFFSSFGPFFFGVFMLK